MAAACCVLASCKTTKQLPVIPSAAVRQTVATEQTSARQPLQKARELSSKAVAKSTDARIGLSSAQADTETYRRRVEMLTSTVQALRDKGSAALADLQALSAELSEQSKFVAALLVKLETVQKQLAEEQILRAEASVALEDVSVRLEAKELEAAQLRQQFVDERAIADAFKAESVYNAEIARQKSEDAASREGQKSTMFKILMGVLTAGAGVGYLYIKKKFLG